MYIYIKPLIQLCHSRVLDMCNRAIQIQVRIGKTTINENAYFN